ncbi:DMT family transporter [Tepidanaerobacter sp. GT38]|uniref:DMT family transporter n=1 Tax=Tepidanaerobacter sp. GT38 TaxID=2722793 RepID=UPI001F3E1185|nr:DMT family transporter [Tepidanaerobacter sp. GT38]MCG1012563.1 DMT family transporter [Tepidanaerobacter sp. GT38]
MNNHNRGLLLVSIGTIFLSTSPILTRWVADLPAGEIAFFRMLLGSMFIFIISKVTGTGIWLKTKDMPKFLLYGLITALHFLLYIASLMYTSIAHSLSLVYTAPIMIAVLTALFFKEPIPRHKYLGIFMVILGIIILAGFEPMLTKEMILGDVMAIGSALCLALYSIAGRRERDNYPLFQYVFWVYFLAAIFLLPVALKNFSLPTPKNFAILLLIALLPTTLGHTLYNAGLRYVHPAYANLIMTQEITSGILLGYFLLGEVPSKNSIMGVIIMLIGLWQVLHARRLDKNQTLGRKT